MSGTEERKILTEDELQDLYNWIDEAPLSRPAKNIGRDFSDGVLCAEVMAFYAPKIVDLHNYVSANSMPQKKVNWETLNRKVFAKVGIRLNDKTILQLIQAKPGAIETLFWSVRCKMLADLAERDEDDYGRGIDSGPSTQERNVGRSPNDIDFSSRRYRPTMLREHDDVADEARMAVLPGAGRVRTAAPKNGDFQGTSASFEAQGFIAAPPKASPPCEDNNNASLPLSQIVYRGQKMVPLALLEESEGEIKSLEEMVKTLLKKVNGYETTISVREQRIADLTFQLNAMRRILEPMPF